VKESRNQSCLALAVLAIASMAHARDFRVRDFGAKGNGTTLDTRAIQRRLTPLPARAAER